MCTVTATEFKRSFGKYLKLAATETISVTHRGKIVFTCVPEKRNLVEKIESFFGIIKEEVSLDSIDRE
ncbi:MAG: type II toxin-antitoxin system prevent-host-death family antitoxin [Bacilli bacterium]|nr:type II toxin-antitoxin system prevent-host-death family antitoxin [Bacilli bacterium]